MWPFSKPKPLLLDQMKEIGPLHCLIVTDQKTKCQYVITRMEDFQTLTEGKIMRFEDLKVK